ncbi:MAG: SEC-C domain-containing protein [Methylobacter tundripaludum]|nr:SEC-C domain-containing protein [Methylobacter tundripaludum]
MTLVIALANADQIIQVSDRRLSAKGQLVDDSSNKAGHAVCDDASFLYSFTGLARVGSHATSRWLHDALYNSAQSDHRFRNIADALAEEATSYFHSSRDLRSLSAVDRRLTVMLTGYTADGLIVNSLISNFQDFFNSVDHSVAQRKFTAHNLVSNCSAVENPTMIQVIGQFSAFTHTNSEPELRQMLEQRAPAEAIRQKAISLIQDIANRSGEHGSVGGKINTATLCRSAPGVPVAGYASDIVENGIHLLDLVNLCTGAPNFHIANVQLSTTSPVVFPRVHRNAPCPCGSGLKYRFCHRR